MNTTETPIASEPPSVSAAPALSALIDRRDSLYKPLVAQHGLVDLTDLLKLTRANEAVATTLRAVGAGSPALTHVEQLRCQVCRGFIARCEVELRHTLHRGNSAVLSAAKLYLATHERA